jgi:hypothetical protein
VSRPAAMVFQVTVHANHMPNFNSVFSQYDEFWDEFRKRGVLKCSNHMRLRETFCISVLRYDDNWRLSAIRTLRLRQVGTDKAVQEFQLSFEGSPHYGCCFSSIFAQRRFLALVCFAFGCDNRTKYRCRGPFNHFPRSSPPFLAKYLHWTMDKRLLCSDCLFFAGVWAAFVAYASKVRWPEGRTIISMNHWMSWPTLSVHFSTTNLSGIDYTQ